MAHDDRRGARRRDGQEGRAGAESALPSTPALRLPEWRYRVVGELARGGMSRVYRALDSVTGHMVALKVLAAELSNDPVRVQRFQLESRRVAALQHRHIVPLLDYGTQGGRLFLVMPIYPATLRDVLAERGPLPFATAAFVAVQVAQALDYAHANGIVHRDVKPENILLDASGHAYLTDFGIAKSTPAAPKDLATAGPLAAAEVGQAPIVSIEYTAPELLLGRPVDPRADVYGLGVVVYEMLTGRVPFPCDDQRVYATLVRMLTERPTHPSAHAPHPLPPGADAAILRTLESAPDRRYAGAGAFASALATLAGSGALTTSPDLAAVSGADHRGWITEVETLPVPPPSLRPVQRDTPL